MVERLTAEDLCDVVHALWADRIDPSRIDEFETWLASEPPQLDLEDLELRSVLGLRRHGG